MAIPALARFAIPIALAVILLGTSAEGTRQTLDALSALEEHTVVDLTVVDVLGHAGTFCPLPLPSEMTARLLRSREGIGTLDGINKAWALLGAVNRYLDPPKAEYLVVALAGTDVRAGDPGAVVTIWAGGEVVLLGASISTWSRVLPVSLTEFAQLPLEALRARLRSVA